MECVLKVTPCMGVWIETQLQSNVAKCKAVTPCMGVWIETHRDEEDNKEDESHPVWVCGLKPVSFAQYLGK